jgi:hypothetical protein
MVLSAVLVVASLAGCQSLPGTRNQQSAVGGGAAGAVLGGVLGGGALATILGGALGAGAGYLISANYDKLTGNKQQNRKSAKQAIQHAHQHPATAADVKNSNTADLNHDGYVTMDEVIAMSKAGLSDQQMTKRLRRTDQVFDLNQQQKSYLVDHGVDRSVVNEMNNINRKQRQQLTNQQNQIISQPSSMGQPSSTY